MPPRAGLPIVGIDMGAERSWSAAWCLWENGRSECFAVVPGIPDLSERERYDAMPPGMYRQLADDGVLVVEEGVRVTSPQTLIDHLVAAGIQPAVVLCDRFLIGPRCVTPSRAGGPGHSAGDSLVRSNRRHCRLPAADR